MKVSFKSLLKYYRTKDWRAYFLLGAFGFLIYRGFEYPLLDIFLFFSIGILLLAFAFSINNFFDVKEDKEKGERVLIQNKRNFFFSTLPAILALLFSFYFGFWVFLFLLIAALTGFFYSAPPIRAKSKPFLDLIFHGLFGGAYILLYPVLVFKKNFTPFDWLLILSAFYLSITAEMRNHLEDYQSDLKAGLKTTVCFLGYKRSEALLKYLASFSPLVFLPLFLTFHLSYILWIFLILSFFFLSFFFLKKNYLIERPYHYRIMDAYTFLTFYLILLAHLYYSF